MELLSTIIFIVCFYHGLRLVFFMIKEIKNAIKGLIRITRKTIKEMRKEKEN